MKTASRRVVALCVALGMMLFGFMPQASAETQGERGDFNSEVSFSSDGVDFYPYPRYESIDDRGTPERIKGSIFSYRVVTQMRLDTRNPQEVRVLMRVRDLADFENDEFVRGNPSEYMVRASVDDEVLGEWNVRDLYEQTPRWEGQDWVKDLDTVRQIGVPLVVQGEPGEVKTVTFRMWLPNFGPDVNQNRSDRVRLWTATRVYPIKPDPSPSEDPSGAEDPAPTDNPAPTSEPSEPAEPSATEVPSPSEEPAPTEEPAEPEEPAATVGPEPTEKPAEPEEPAVTEGPSESEEPTPTEDPSPADEPEPSQEPTGSGDPTPTEEPSTTEDPSSTEAPSPTEEPTPSEEPVPTDDPSPTGDPSPADDPSEPAEPSGSSEPSASATPSPDGQGSLSPAGSSPAEEPAWHPITSASVPPTLPDESPSEGETASTGEPSTKEEPSSTDGPTPGEKSSARGESSSSGEPVSAAASSRPGSLARTGLDGGVVVLGSLLVIGAGISAVLVARHRARKA